ncbi:MAG: histidine phosphatase family protein [Clostridia bacterium]|nr:histidine phosphatase family protein [Clostridia bacterium]
MLLFYIRHGDPIYNPDSLTPQGEKQAAALAKRLAMYGIDRIYVSPSNRARLTSVPTCELLGKKAQVKPWMDEALAAKYFFVDNGKGGKSWCFAHRPTIELFSSPEVRAMGKEWHRHAAFAEEHFSEGVAHIGGELDAFMLEQGYRHDAQNNRYVAERPNHDRIAMFAHQGIGMAIMSLLLDVPYPIFATTFDFGHSGMTVVEFSGEENVYPKVLQLSGDAHLYREGLPTKYQNRLYF